MGTLSQAIFLCGMELIGKMSEESKDRWVKPDRQDLRDQLDQLDRQDLKVKRD
jgi:hypothetical protein